MQGWNVALSWQRGQLHMLHKSALLPARPAGLVDTKQCTVGPKGSLVLSGLMSLTLQVREKRGKVCRLIISNHRPEGHVSKSVQGPGSKGQRETDAQHLALAWVDAWGWDVHGLTCCMSLSSLLPNRQTPSSALSGHFL